ncbi:MAG: hypothetical protein OEZ23_02955 [Gammaproteobacteria bacterium]|nr:hypothetical protein [Gammaproteobacteria bacterium]
MELAHVLDEIRETLNEVKDYLGRNSTDYPEDSLVEFQDRLSSIEIVCLAIQGIAQFNPSRSTITNHALRIMCLEVDHSTIKLVQDLLGYYFLPETRSVAGDNEPPILSDPALRKIKNHMERRYRNYYHTFAKESDAYDTREDLVKLLGLSP